MECMKENEEEQIIHIFSVWLGMSLTKREIQREGKRKHTEREVRTYVERERDRHEEKMGEFSDMENTDAYERNWNFNVGMFGLNLTSGLRVWERQAQIWKENRGVFWYWKYGNIWKKLSFQCWSAWHKSSFRAKGLGVQAPTWGLAPIPWICINPKQGLRVWESKL